MKFIIANSFFNPHTTNILMPFNNKIIIKILFYVFSTLIYSYLLLNDEIFSNLYPYRNNVVFCFNLYITF